MPAKEWLKSPKVNVGAKNKHPSTYIPTSYILLIDWLIVLEVEAMSSI